MEIVKMTFGELEDSIKSWDKAVVVFTVDSFDMEYSENSRSYEISSDAKYFNPIMIGNSLFGNCLDGTDDGVRLDFYMGERWKVEYCYITKQKEENK